MDADDKAPYERSGSCAIIMVLVNYECYIANIGDSRAIMSGSHGKKLFLLSRDHKPNVNSEKSRVLENGGQIYQTPKFGDTDAKGRAYGPHRILPGRLSVARTIGDIEAKNPKYGGKEKVIIAQPEISKFTLNPDFHDFILLGCDGIFDKMEN